MFSLWVQSRRSTQTPIDKKALRSFGGEKVFYNSIERTILQSIWVLFVEWYFLLIAIVAIVATSEWIRRHSSSHIIYKKRDTHDRQLSKMENGTRDADILTIIDTSLKKNIESKDRHRDNIVDVSYEDVSEAKSSDEGANYVSVIYEE